MKRASDQARFCQCSMDEETPTISKCFEVEKQAIWLLYKEIACSSPEAPENAH